MPPTNPPPSRYRLLSANQLHTTVRDAAIAAGHASGTAVEIAAAALLLCTQNPTAATRLPRALATADPTAILSAAEHLIAHPTDPLPPLRTAFPPLAAALLAWTGLLHRTAFTAAAPTQNTAVTVPAATPSALPNLAPLAGARTLVITRAAAPPSLIARPLPARIAIPPGAWRRLQTMAANTTVPASPESRHTGAGAGAIDND